MENRLRGDLLTLVQRLHLPECTILSPTLLSDIRREFPESSTGGRSFPLRLPLTLHGFQKVLPGFEWWPVRPTFSNRRLDYYMRTAPPPPPAPPGSGPSTIDQPIKSKGAWSYRPLSYSPMTRRYSEEVWLTDPRLHQSDPHQSLPGMCACVAG